MKKIIIVQTPYQLIVSLYIREQFARKNDIVDLVITENFNNCNKIIERLKNLKVFNNIFSITKNNYDFLNGNIKNVKKFFFLLNPNSINNKIIKFNQLYDELYFWNYDVISESIRSFLIKKNQNLKTYIFEEGYISYFPLTEIQSNWKTINLIKLRNKFLGIKNFDFHNIDGYLFFNPELSIFDTKVKKYKIERNIDKSNEIKDNIKYIFDVADVSKKYDKKFIIFEEAVFSNSNQFDDEKIILDIVSKVGKENVLIKLHPRTKEDRFSKLGIKTLGADGIPWEAITLTGDFSNNVFIAIGSGSIVNYRLTFGKKMKGILLFKIVKPNFKYMSSTYDQFWKKVESKYPEGGIYIPSTIDELNNILEEIKKEDCDKK